MNHYVKMVDGVPKKLLTKIVHRFNIAEADDPDIFAAQPLWEWQQSEAGKFIMEKAIETPIWNKQLNHETFSYTFVITAKLFEADALYFELKFK